MIDDQEELTRRFMTEPRFHAIVKALQNAAFYGGRYPVLEAMRVAARLDGMFNDHA
jgi:phosphopantetheinyl transferase (holo-ACP synthase)